MINKGVHPAPRHGILTAGWVNPRITATPFTGYRKRTVSASALGTVQDFAPKTPFRKDGGFHLVRHS